MSRSTQQLIAVVVLIVLGADQILIQPENLALWPNPKLVSLVLSIVAMAAGILRGELSGFVTDGKTDPTLPNQPNGPPQPPHG